MIAVKANCCQALRVIASTVIASCVDPGGGLTIAVKVIAVRH